MQDTTQIVSLKEAFPWLSVRPSEDHPAFNCPAERVPALMQSLRDEHGYPVLSDLTAVDWGVGASVRFTVFYHLYSLERNDYLRIAADCPGGEEPYAYSVTALWKGANWLERETYDMFGIDFKGHPDLRRILMWDNYPYHPLRKDFPLAGKEAPLNIEDDIGQTILDGHTQVAPMAGGPFNASCGHTMSKAEPRAKDQSWSEKKPKENL